MLTIRQQNAALRYDINRLFLAFHLHRVVNVIVRGCSLLLASSWAVIFRYPPERPGELASRLYGVETIHIDSGERSRISLPRLLTGDLLEIFILLHILTIVRVTS